MQLRWLAYMLVGGALVACATGGRTGEPPVDASGDTAVEPADASPDCGNGVLDGAEACDDGNTDGGDGCSASCAVEDGWSCTGEPSVCTSLCGNGALDTGEECDGVDLGGADCTTVPGGYTGGTLACTAGCLYDTVGCVLASCGDGVVDAGEQCDDANTSNNDGCLNNCQSATCGDGYQQTGVEECDDGNPSNADSCLNTCVSNVCGDGHLWVGVEACDDGNTASGDGCSATCVVESCGDGVVQAGLGEQCDDGNVSNNDACLNTCVSNVCGDGHLYIGVEECDDGNGSAGDGCNASCDAEYCGDGIVQTGIGEQCEGGSQGCTASCGTSGTQSCTGSCTWGSCSPPGETCNAEDDDCNGTIDTSSCLVQVWRFYNSSTGDHMYKTSQSPDSGYVLESTYFRVYTTNVPGTHALYQRFNGTDHLMTYDPTEGDGWYYGATVLGYVAPNTTWNAAGYSSSELCRYYASSSGDHFVYTYVSNADLPTVFPEYAREGCGNYVWDFH